MKNFFEVKSPDGGVVIYINISEIQSLVATNDEAYIKFIHSEAEMPISLDSFKRLRKEIWGI